MENRRWTGSSSTTRAAASRPPCCAAIIRRHAKAAGLPPTTAAHGLRHAGATEMLKGGASVRHVQELLGHLSLATPQIYTRVLPADLQKVHASTAPGERRKKLDVSEFECRGFRDKKNQARLYQQPWNR